jgi:Holliday junction DNA helicase RuvA
LITKISGKLVALADDAATLAIEALEYEVLVPVASQRELQARVGQPVSLHTIHYLDGNPNQGRVVPRLVGFLSVVEREFFELFCSVDGVGAKKALRAMVRPVKDIAEMIESQDAKGLSTLPGIGPATADRIIAKLRRKMSKFALMVSRQGVATADGGPGKDLVRETFDVLCALGHSEAAARQLIDSVIDSKKKFTDVEELIQAIFQQTHSGGGRTGKP